jgi:polysaccharide biosynthesis/export protein
MHSLPAITSAYKSAVPVTTSNYVLQPMVLSTRNAFILLLTAVGLLLSFASCTPAKNTTYFQNMAKDTTLHNVVTTNFETKIQKNDLLQITVTSMSPDNTIYNAPQNASGAATGYLVDDSGNITFIKLGAIHAEGMTKKELKVKLEKDLVPYLREAIVSIGILNRHVTMLGALGSQVLPLTTENMTLLDALASAGDIGEKGRTDNILVIREKDEGKEFKRLNLTDNSIFYSPYFYIQPNDIVYVEPARLKAKNTAQIISYFTAGISLVILILNQFLK